MPSTRRAASRQWLQHLHFRAVDRVGNLFYTLVMPSQGESGETLMTERVEDLETLARDVRIHVFQEAAATAQVPQAPAVSPTQSLRLGAPSSNRDTDFPCQHLMKFYLTSAWQPKK